MKRIGIVTIHDLDNYGNRLQNYALNRVLINEGFNVRNFILKNKRVSIRGMIKIVLLPFLSGSRKLCTMRLIRFLSFQKNMKTICYSNKKKYEEYDYFITGSDQVWHPKWYGTPYMFLNFVPPTKRISYAASFGLSRIPNDRIQEFKESLSSFKCISVREKNGAAIIEELIGSTPTVSIDPSLLLNSSEWSIASKKPCFDTNGEYILTYFLGNVDDKVNEYIERVAVELNAKTVRLEKNRPEKYWYQTGPSEFIWLIKHCKYMVTDSFHGSIFSIIMRKPFVVCERNDSLGNMNSRLDTLLDMFNLENHKFHDDVFFIADRPNDDIIKYVLEQKRKESIDYLRSALEN